MARLRVLPANARPWEVELTGPVVIGRSTPADIVIPEALISRRHCRVAPDDASGWTVEDLGSSNGTTLDGARVERAPLASGNRIGLGFAAVEFLAP